MVKERILVVDGAITQLSVIITKLQAMGFLVDYANNAERALTLLETKWVDLIILNVALKGNMDGVEFYRRVKKRKKFQNIPVIIQANKASAHKMFERIGAKTYFIKPIHMTMFIHEALDIMLKKVLLVVYDKRTRAALEKHLVKFDCRVDVVDTPQKFYDHAIGFRYVCVIAQDKVRKVFAEKIVSVVRGCVKNNETPVFIYTAEAKKNMGPKRAQEFERTKSIIREWDACEFIDDKQPVKKIIEKVEALFSA